MNLILFIIRLFISLISIIKINLLIFFLSFLRPKKKFILFYYPEKKLTYKDIDYIEDLFKDIGEKYYILYGHRLNNFHRKNYFFISQKFLNFIFGINLFVSTYISDNFPSKSIKIFIYHCVYDTPLAEKKKEFEITLRISNYNYIFLSSDFVVKYFYDLIKKFPESKKRSEINNTRIIPTGYPRLDYLSKNAPKNKNKDAIIIAPANFLAYPEHTIINHLENIIFSLLENFNYQIIYRPHPNNIISNSNRSKKTNNLIYKIKEKFKKYKKFEFDTSDNYLDNYFRSTCMITDLSGTSYTFAFLTLRPVIFFSPNEKIIQSEYENLNHFKDRKNIGVIVNDFNDINNKIAYFDNDQSYYKNSILNTKKKLLYVNNSKMEIHKNISKILT